MSIQATFSSGIMPIPAKFKCPISKALMQNPVKANCGHVFDASSIPTNTTTMCPRDNSTLTSLTPCLETITELNAWKKEHIVEVIGSSALAQRILDLGSGSVSNLAPGLHFIEEANKVNEVACEILRLSPSVNVSLLQSAIDNETNSDLIGDRGMRTLFRILEETKMVAHNNKQQHTQQPGNTEMNLNLLHTTLESEISTHLDGMMSMHLSTIDKRFDQQMVQMNRHTSATNARLDQLTDTVREMRAERDAEKRTSALMTSVSFAYGALASGCDAYNNPVQNVYSGQFGQVVETDMTATAAQAGRAFITNAATVGMALVMIKNIWDLAKAGLSAAGLWSRARQQPQQQRFQLPQPQAHTTTTAASTTTTTTAATSTTTTAAGQQRA